MRSSLWCNIKLRGGACVGRCTAHSTIFQPTLSVQKWVKINLFQAVFTTGGQMPFICEDSLNRTVTSVTRWLKRETISIQIEFVFFSLLLLSWNTMLPLHKLEFWPFGKIKSHSIPHSLLVEINSSLTLLINQGVNSSLQYNNTKYAKFNQAFKS